MAIYRNMENLSYTLVLMVHFCPIGLCDFTMNGEWRRIGSAHSMRAISAPSPISITSSKLCQDIIRISFSGSSKLCY